MRSTWEFGNLVLGVSLAACKPAAEPAPTNEVVASGQCYRDVRTRTNVVAKCIGSRLARDRARLHRSRFTDH